MSSVMPVNVTSRRSRWPAAPGDAGTLLGSLGLCDVWCLVADASSPTESGALMYRLRPELLGDPALVRRFIHAGRRAMQLRHPGIVRVEYVRGEAPLVAIVTERVQGVTLRSLTERARCVGVTIPVWLALHVAGRICDAVAYAHHFVDDQGIPSPVYHPGLVAEEMVLTPEGVVKVAAFGLPDAREWCRTDGADGVPDESGEILAVDRVQGMAAAARDTRRIAGVLFELLTLRPFDEDAPGPGVGDSGAVNSFIPPSRLAPWVPPSIDELLRRALAGPRARSFLRADALGAAIEVNLGAMGHDEIGDEHVAAFLALVKQLEADGRESARLMAPPATPTSPAVSPPEASTADRERPRRSEIPPPAGRDSAAAWDAAVSSSRRGSASQPPLAASEVGFRERATGSDAPAEVLAGALAAFEEGLDRLRRGDLAGAEAAWLLALDLEPDLRAAEANLKLLRQRRGSHRP